MGDLAQGGQERGAPSKAVVHRCRKEGGGGEDSKRGSRNTEMTE